jgi:hypothetical protein
MLRWTKTSPIALRFVDSDEHGKKESTSVPHVRGYASPPRTEMSAQRGEGRNSARGKYRSVRVVKWRAVRVVVDF